MPSSSLSYVLKTNLLKNFNMLFVYLFRKMYTARQCEYTQRINTYVLCFAYFIVQNDFFFFFSLLLYLFTSFFFVYNQAKNENVSLIGIKSIKANNTHLPTTLHTDTQVSGVKCTFIHKIKCILYSYKYKYECTLYCTYFTYRKYTP